MNEIIHDFNEIQHEIKIYEKNRRGTLKKLKFFRLKDFNVISEEIEEYLSQLTDELEKMMPKNIDIQSIYFILYELLINIYKHSKFKNAYIKIDASDENMDIYIIDDGIGIPGSFKEAKMECINDNNTIFEAINGETTDKEKYNLHGRGLNSSARITTLGFKGKMSILSGNEICIIDEYGLKSSNDNYFFNGTFIHLQLKNRKIKNIYKYLKFERINRIEVVKNESN
jgi:anti-sigma regulatory factor (Ser/Thr protein kinase)